MPLNNPPQNPLYGDISTKLLLGVVIGSLVSGFVAVLMVSLGTESFLISSQLLFPFLLMSIAFFASLIGGGMLLASFSLFFPKTYIDIRTAVSLYLSSNGFLFFVFAFAYFFVQPGASAAYVLLGFHIGFACFVTSTLLECTVNPQYAGSAMLGNAIGFGLCVVLYVMVFFGTQGLVATTKIYYLMLLPPMISFSLIPGIYALWAKIYYGLYEMGNNFLYIYTPEELSKQREEEEQKDTSTVTDDINVE